MPIYKSLHLALPFDVDSDVWKKLKAYAEKRSITVEEAFQAVATMGLYAHLSNNLDFLDKYNI
mgnify:CR=1 FL=1